MHSAQGQNPPRSLIASQLRDKGPGHQPLATESYLGQKKRMIKYPFPRQIGSNVTQKQSGFKFLATLLPPDSTEEPLLLFQSSSWCRSGQVPIPLSECSRAYLTSRKTLRSEARRQQILFQHWLREPTKGGQNTRLVQKGHTKAVIFSVCDSRTDLKTFTITVTS